MSSDRNVTRKETEKNLKYKILRMEIQRIWNMKCFLIPVITGATWIITKGLNISVNNTRKTLDRFCNIKKTAVLGTSRIKWKVLQSETWSLKWWDAPLVQEEEYQGKKRDDDYDDDGMMTTFTSLIHILQQWTVFVPNVPISRIISVSEN
jgi:hypothetical protein